MKTRGQILIQTLVLSALAVVFISVLANLANFNIVTSSRSLNSELAFQIAESGVEYYRWHLAHAPQDFQDGTGGPGPYVHEFKDREGNAVGTFTLAITPPAVGSTVVTIESTGTVSADPLVSRTIRTQLAIPSFAKYAVVANADMRFGEGTEVFGPVHSNGGIHFDGTAHNIVSSAKEDYNDPDHSGNDEFGVHTHRNQPPATGTDPTFRPQEAPPTTPVPTRADVFLGGRQFPVPAIDFTGLTANLSQIKSDAQASGRYFANSGALGYEIVFRPDDTFEVYKVTSITSSPNGCIEVLGQQDWGTWSVKATSTQGLSNPYAIPANGLIFVEDSVWVRGTINTARVTVAVARFPESPSQRRHITVNNDLLYTNYDGQDSIGLIAQGNINVGWESEDDLRIDAALIAQNGRVGRYYYRPPSGNQNRCAPYHVRQVITLYGMIGTNERYGFSYTDGTGYLTRNIIYDPNLLYAPPPSFPLTSDQYQTISWEEVKR